MTLDVYRNVSVIDSFSIDERTLFVQKFLGENYIHAEATVQTTLNITIGDYVKYNGIKYYVNTLPNVIKNSTNQYVYTMVFESEYYNFQKVQYRYSDLGDFYLMGNLELFVDLLVTNMNRDLGGWTKGTCTQSNTEYRLMKFEAESCRSVIQRLCAEFSGEFSFARKVISFSDEKTYDTGLTFQYKTGLRNIQRKPIDSGNLITRLYAYGSEKNLGSAYGKLRLELKTVAPLPTNKDYIESNVATYGTIEGSVIFDDIYPRYTGTVSSAASTVKFTQATFPFDVNTYLIPGVTAKVNFKTGDCAGYTFDIYTYTNATKEFEIIPVELEDGTSLPNATLNPGAGNEFVVFDITMPAAYILAAEAELQALAVAYLDKYDHPRVAYNLIPDWRYTKTNNVNLTIGSTITIADTDLGISTKVRITELTQQLLYPYKYVLSMTDQVEYQHSNSTTELILGAYKKADEGVRKIAASPISDIGKSRRNWRDSEELRNKVFDPDGYYFTYSIKPLSIETTMLAAGSKSGNFELNAVIIQPNYLGDNNKLTISGGTLVHFGIDSSEADNIGTWTLVANTTYVAGGLTTGTAYYLYAKCDKDDYTAGTNQIIVSTTAYQADQTTDWYFLVGILHSTAGSTPRGLSLTYGQTLINGGHITTGKIASANGNTYFDLDGNTLVIGSASGYANISDKPTDLAGINGTEGAKLTGIEALADVTSTHIAAAIANLPATPSGAGLFCDATHLGYYSGAAWTSYIASDGKFYFTGDATNAIAWDGSTLTVRGSLNADDITAGTLTGRTIQTAATGKRIVMDSANNNTVWYDNGGNPRVTIDGNSAPFVDLSYADIRVTSSYIDLVSSVLRINGTDIINTYGALVGVTGVTLVSGNITLGIGGLVDGRDVSVDGGKLDGIAAGAQVGTVTSVTAGTGLSGGAITGSGTISVNYGTTNITACVGNDSRLSDARTPTAHNQSWATITSGVPTTLAGYGITDAAPLTHVGSAATAGHSGLGTAAASAVGDFAPVAHVGSAATSAHSGLGTMAAAATGDYLAIGAKAASATIADTASAVAAADITGTTLAATVVTSSLTTVGTLINLTVTNKISGSINGNCDGNAGGSSASCTGNAATADKVNAALTAGTGLTVLVSPIYDGSTARTFNVSFGTTSSTVCVGDDSRLSDARTPAAHTHEGTAILSSGPVAAGKVLTAIGNGFCAWV